MNLNTTKFFNSDEVYISSKMNEYLKNNFGYEITGDLESLREAKASLEVTKAGLKDEYMSAKYVENMLMLETIKSLLKAHGITGKTPIIESELSSNVEKVLHTDSHYSVVEVTPAEQATRATIVLRHWEKEISRGFYEPMDDAFVMSFGDKTTRMFETPEDLIKFMKVGSEKYYADRKEDTSEEVNEEKISVDGQGSVETDYYTVIVSSGDMGIVVDIKDKNDNEIDSRQYWDEDAIGEGKEPVTEDDNEEKGPDHYRWKNDSQLSIAKDKLIACMAQLDHAIDYRAENSHLFFNTGDKAGTGDLYRMKEQLEKLHDGWEEATELYGM